MQKKTDFQKVIFVAAVKANGNLIKVTSGNI